MDVKTRTANVVTVVTNTLLKKNLQYIPSLTTNKASKLLRVTFSGNLSPSPLEKISLGGVKEPMTINRKGVRIRTPRASSIVVLRAVKIRLLP